MSEMPHGAYIHKRLNQERRGKMAMAIIEARDESHEWDSDYVGTQAFPVEQCRDYVRQLLHDPDWDGWQFRILADDGDGCYCVPVDIPG